ncbi:ryncolin-1-like isoform X1 [Littorina saxatilis]|uniref:ryncolin-1-like isoform X1 n=1 Tax=Littorina saxatilis TaxID=31220 RepID=UPI0038B6812B
MVLTGRPRVSCLYKVYCRMDSDGTRLYVMTRTTDTTTFNRDWAAYRDGFGDLDGDNWLGLEKLHVLTAGDQRYRLRVKVDVLNDDNYETYGEFRVGDESENYKLSVNLNQSDPCFAIRNGLPFTTTDRDNDEVAGINCARRFGGGWWFFTNNTCSLYCNPTGELVFNTAGGNYTGDRTHAFWQHWAPVAISMYLMHPEV